MRSACRTLRKRTAAQLPKNKDHAARLKIMWQEDDPRFADRQADFPDVRHGSGADIDVQPNYGRDTPPPPRRLRKSQLSQPIRLIY